MSQDLGVSGNGVRWALGTFPFEVSATRVATDDFYSYYDVKLSGVIPSGTSPYVAGNTWGPARALDAAHGFLFDSPDPLPITDCEVEPPITTTTTTEPPIVFDGCDFLNDEQFDSFQLGGQSYPAKGFRAGDQTVFQASEPTNGKIVLMRLFVNTVKKGESAFPGEILYTIPSDGTYNLQFSVYYDPPGPEEGTPWATINYDCIAAGSEPPPPPATTTTSEQPTATTSEQPTTTTKVIEDEVLARDVTTTTTTVDVVVETLPFTGADNGPQGALALAPVAAGVLALVGARSFQASTEE